MQKMEATHFQQVEDIQSLYERKLLAQDSDYLNLEQAKLEMEQQYKAKIKSLVSQNEQSINKLLESFRTDLNKVQDEFEECKRTANGLKVYYDQKLDVLDTEHEDEIDLINMKHKDQVSLLKEE